MKKYAYNIFIASLFMATTAVEAMSSGSAPEILREEIQHHLSNSLTDETYPHTYRVVHNPEVVKIYENALHGASFKTFEETAPEDVNVILQSGRKDITYFGMEEYKFSDNALESLPFLYTYGLRDCIALVAFDAHSKKSCLYHVSKMALRINDSGSRSFDTHFVKEFFNFFGFPSNPHITLIGSCYSNDLDLMLRCLEKWNITVNDYNFPDVVLEEFIVKDESTHRPTQGTTTLFINKDTVSLPHNNLLSTAVMLNTENGDITIARS